MDHRGRGERRRKIRRVSKTGGPRYGQEMCWHFAKAVLLAATGQVRWYRRFFDLSLKKFKGRFFVCSLSFHRSAFPQKERAPHRTKGRAHAFHRLRMQTKVGGFIPAQKTANGTERNVCYGKEKCNGRREKGPAQSEQPDSGGCFDGRGHCAAAAGRGNQCGWIPSQFSHCHLLPGDSADPPLVCGVGDYRCALRCHQPDRHLHGMDRHCF